MLSTSQKRPDEIRTTPTIPLRKEVSGEIIRPPLTKTDWKKAVQWGISKGLLSYRPQPFGDLSPDLRKRLEEKEKELNGE